MKKLLLCLMLFCLVLLFSGCASIDRHHGHIYIRDPNHIEVVFDRPMTMELEKDGIKVKASSLKPGFLEQVLQVMLLSPR